LLIKQLGGRAGELAPPDEFFHALLAGVGELSEAATSANITVIWRRRATQGKMLGFEERVHDFLGDHRAEDGFDAAAFGLFEDDAPGHETDIGHERSSDNRRTSGINSGLNVKQHPKAR